MLGSPETDSSKSPVHNWTLLLDSHDKAQSMTSYDDIMVLLIHSLPSCLQKEYEIAVERLTA